MTEAIQPVIADTHRYNQQHESFPSVVYDVINDENVPLTKETFMLIDDVECENG